MSLTITSPAAGSAVAGSFTVTGQSVQSVNSVALAAQTYAASLSATGIYGNHTYTVSNSSGDSATLAVIANLSNGGDTIAAGGTSHLVDAAGNDWTIVSGQVSKNGTIDGSTSSVTLMLYYNGFIYHENSLGNFYEMTGGTWVFAGGDPRLSPSGSTIPSLSSITDSALNVWTLVSGQVAKNGTIDSSTSGVVLILYYGNIIYHKNSVGNFYSWSDSAWVYAGSVDPRVSASGTTIPSAAAITDASLNRWTLTGGVVDMNGAAAGFTASVVLVLYYGGVIYQENAPGNWWSWTSGAWVAVAGDPRAPAYSSPNFYGINMHPGYSWTPAVMTSSCQSVKCNNIRFDCWDTTTATKVAADYTAIKAIDSTFKVMPCISQPPEFGSSEATNYSDAYALAASMATILYAAGITDYECGNEILTYSEVFPTAGIPGDSISDYNNANWPAARGWIRGLIDGVKSVHSAARCGVNFCIAQVAASDMLWNGTAPDGSTGHPTVRWDITTWHNYQVYGNLFAIGTETHGSAFNLIAYVAAAYGKPIMITEWNSNPEDTDAAGAAFMATWLANAYANRVTYDIESVFFYQADGGPADFGLFYFTAKTAEYLSFATANPA